MQKKLRQSLTHLRMLQAPPLITALAEDFVFTIKIKGDAEFNYNVKQGNTFITSKNISSFVCNIGREGALRGDIGCCCVKYAAMAAVSADSAVIC